MHTSQYDDTNKKTRTLSVPGANLYYEVRGSGPVLLMIHGGNGDADVYFGVAEHLADLYTIVTYDRRGYSRSKLANTTDDYRVETHSNDVHRLLTEITNKPAYVFGSSAGAIIGLDLAIRHPEQIKLLITHEPPLTHLLSGEEQAQARQIQENLENTGRNEGAIPAIKQFASTLGIENNASSYRPNAEQVERIFSNIGFFVMHEAPAIRRYTLDIEALKNKLKTTTLQIIAGVGIASRSTFPHQCAIALAEHLAVKIVDFPGNHIGYMNNSAEFARKLLEVLENENQN